MGRRQHTRNFTFIAAPGSGETARLGLAIGRRADKRAVGRNRLKRAAREAFRRVSLPPLDIVITARPTASRVAGGELQAELLRGFEALKASCAK